VIVTIAAWLYIVQAVLMLASLLLSPFAMGGIEGALTLALAGLFAAMGVGLFKRLSWARWLALGSSLLGWTLGALFLVVLLGYLFILAPAAAFLMLLFSSGLFSVLGLLIVFSLLVWVANIVISYKLFWYLCSETGCAEFGAPHGSTQAVVASCGAWVAITIVNIMASNDGQAINPLAMIGNEEPAVPERERQMQLEQERAVTAHREKIEYAERRARSEALLRQQAEAEQAEAAAEPVAVEAPLAAAEPAAEPAAETQVPEEAPVPEPQPLQQADEESEPPASSRIVKCLDAAGGTIYTQGYCPPGSKLAR
jgi:hypothetical protein